MIIIITTGMLVTVHSVGIDTLLMSHINNNQAQQTGGFAIQLGTHKCREERRDLNNLAQDTVTDSTISMDLVNYFNTCYLAEMHLGTPPQPMTVLLDTGSAFNWFLSDLANQNLGFTKYYDHTKSSTFVDPNYGIEVGITFGSGALRGSFKQDRFSLGDINSPNALIMDNFEFGFTHAANCFE